MALLTHQEIFDKVCNHLRTQRQKALDEWSSSCQYRTPDGRRCAIGALFNPDIETHGFEGVGPRALLDPNRYINGLGAERVKDFKAALIASSIPTDRDTLRLLDELQGVHDNGGSPLMESWENGLKHVATEFGLAYAEPA